MQPPGAETVVVRHGELYTKTPRVKTEMVDRLIENLEAILADRGIPATVEEEWHRLFVRTSHETVQAAAAAAADTFGVVSASPAVEVQPTQETIEETLAAAAQAHYDGGSFAVDVHRADKDKPFTSEDLERTGGTAIWEAVADEFDPTVDLESPDVTFGVEVRDTSAYVSLERHAGPGGLPLGTQEPLVVLVSGGIDSPVAAYEVMRRGCPVVPVYVDLGPYGGSDHAARATETVRTLAQYAPNRDMRVREVPGGETVAHLVKTMERGRMLALRRFFFRAAAHVAEETGAVGLVTGEVIGQKSSQTATNLAVTAAATDLPVHRPLLTMDKSEIVDQAREIGTFTDSTIAAGCNRVAPDEVETGAGIDSIRHREPDDLFERARAAAADVRVVDSLGETVTHEA